MKVKFLVPRSLDGYDYAKGEQEVPDSLAGHWYLLALIQNGDALVVVGPAEVKPVKPVKPVEQKDETYREHMADWVSKDEQKEADQKAAPLSKDEKKKATAAKAAATRAAKKAALAKSAGA
jgi:hypothetical protein